MSIMKLAAGLATSVLLASSLAGCAAPDPSSCLPEGLPAPATGGVVLVHTPLRNELAPAVVQDEADLITSTVAHGGDVALVIGDGTPRWEMLHASSTKSPANNCDVMVADAEKVTRLAAQAVSSARADANGNDLVAAIDLAAQVATSKHYSTIYVQNSGLSDQGALNFSLPGYLQADSADITSLREVQDSCIDMQGLTLILAGIGQTVDREPIPRTTREHIQETWKGHFEDCGATTQLLSTPRLAVDDLDTPYSRAPVHVPAATAPTLPADGGAGTVELPEVRFVSGQAALSDPEAARQVLDPVAVWLVQHPGAQANVLGRTDSSGSQDANYALSDKRATTVAAELTRNHPELADRVTTTAQGENAPGRLPDELGDGSLDPANAAANRVVVIEIRS